MSIHKHFRKINQSNIHIQHTTLEKIKIFEMKLLIQVLHYQTDGFRYDLNNQLVVFCFWWFFFSYK